MSSRETPGRSSGALPADHRLSIAQTARDLRITPSKPARAQRGTCVTASLPLSGPQPEIPSNPPASRRDRGLRTVPLGPPGVVACAALRLQPQDRPCVDPRPWFPRRTRGPISGSSTTPFTSTPRDRETPSVGSPSRVRLYAVVAQTEMCWRLSLVNGSRFQSLQRSRKVIPASCAIRSSSPGQT